MQIHGRPWSLFSFDWCDRCHIDLWAVKKLIRLCEKKYHTDLHARYNNNKTIPDTLKSYYQKKFMECQQAKKFFKNESMLLATNRFMDLIGFDYPQCNPNCWKCLGIDQNEFIKYGISIDTHPNCSMGKAVRSPEYESIKAKKTYFQNIQIFQKICGVEEHLNIQKMQSLNLLT